MTPAESGSPLISVRGLTKTYGLLPVLRGLDLDIYRGECVSLLGANGSGKSTFLRLVSALSKPTSGTITVGGWELPREAAAVRAQIGMVAHKPLLYENLTALENLHFFARLYHVQNTEARSAELLERVGLARRAQDLVRTFSRGMLQRLAIARALLHDPDVLLFDEPHTGLDQDAAAMLDAVVLDQRAGGRTVLMATHELERAARLSSRVVILARGAINHDMLSSGLTGADLAALYTEESGRPMKGTPFFAAAGAIFRKDVRAELRSRELIGSMVLFALLAVLVFSFALELNRQGKLEAISGVLWVTLIFASILGLNRSMAMERDQGNLDALLLAPISRPAIYIGKLAGNLVFVLSVAVALAFVITILFDATLFDPRLLLVLALGGIGYSTVGTLLAAMSVQTRARESLLPIIMLPVALPLLLASVRATSALLTGAPEDQWVPWLSILMVLDVIFLVLGFLLFEFVVED